MALVIPMIRPLTPIDQPFLSGGATLWAIWVYDRRPCQWIDDDEARVILVRLHLRLESFGATERVLASDGLTRTMIKSMLIHQKRATVD